MVTMAISQISLNVNPDLDWECFPKELTTRKKKLLESCSGNRLWGFTVSEQNSFWCCCRDMFSPPPWTGIAHEIDPIAFLKVIMRWSITVLFVLQLKFHLCSRLKEKNRIQENLKLLSEETNGECFWNGAWQKEGAFANSFEGELDGHFGLTKQWG